MDSQTLLKKIKTHRTIFGDSDGLKYIAALADPNNHMSEAYLSSYGYLLDHIMKLKDSILQSPAGFREKLLGAIKLTYLNILLGNQLDDESAATAWSMSYTVHPKDYIMLDQLPPPEFIPSKEKTERIPHPKECLKDVKVDHQSKRILRVSRSVYGKLSTLGGGDAVAGVEKALEIVAESKLNRSTSSAIVRDW